MEITKPSLSKADVLVSLWLELAEGQREFGSHLLQEPNQLPIRETISQHIATGRVYVAREDIITGFVTFTVEVTEFEQDVTRGIVENLYVTPEYRDEGVGSELLTAAEEDLRERGVDVISLEAMADNESARAFYRSRGYRPHRIEMEKSLDESN
jgi:ribosomal protein S18 acetylase RimI-like enzyme